MSEANEILLASSWYPHGVADHTFPSGYRESEGHRHNHDVERLARLGEVPLQLPPNAKVGGITSVDGGRLTPGLSSSAPSTSIAARGQSDFQLQPYRCRSLRDKPSRSGNRE